MAVGLTAPSGVIVPDAALLDRGTFEAWCRTAAHLGLRTVAEDVGESVALFGAWEMRLALPGPGDSQDESLAPHLWSDGFWESWVSLAVARAVRPGFRVVDVGAHLGWYTLLALARGAGRVFAVEPQVELSQVLRGTLWENGLAGRVDHWVGAVGAHWSVADLLLYGKMTGSASVDPHAAEGWTPTRRVRTGVAPLDGILTRPLWERVDLIKMDVEGSERDAWEGMQATLARNPRAAVVMEVGAERGYDLGGFLREIDLGGFRIRKVGYDGALVDPPLDRSILDRDKAGEWATLWVDCPLVGGAAA